MGGPDGTPYKWNTKGHGLTTFVFFPLLSLPPHRSQYSLALALLAHFSNLSPAPAIRVPAPPPGPCATAHAHKNLVHL
jgi:hypothetical protein